MTITNSYFVSYVSCKCFCFSVKGLFKYLDLIWAKALFTLTVMNNGSLWIAMLVHAKISQQLLDVLPEDCIQHSWFQEDEFY